MQDGLYAKFNTTKGEILVALEFKKTPGTVGNFVALAEGNLENKVKPQGTPYYNGLKFHRVIPDFMVQGGCPQGSGSGDPGYKFDDEFHPDLKHDVREDRSQAMRLLPLIGAQADQFRHFIPVVAIHRS